MEGRGIVGYIPEELTINIALLTFRNEKALRYVEVPEEMSNTAYWMSQIPKQDLMYLDYFDAELLDSDELAPAVWAVAVYGNNGNEFYRWGEHERSRATSSPDSRLSWPSSSTGDRKFLHKQLSVPVVDYTVEQARRRLMTISRNAALPTMLALVAPKVYWQMDEETEFLDMAGVVLREISRATEN